MVSPLPNFTSSKLAKWEQNLKNAVKCFSFFDLVFFGFLLVGWLGFFDFVVNGSTTIQPGFSGLGMQEKLINQTGENYY